MSEVIDYDPTEQPTLSPSMLAKIADTMTRRLGNVYAPVDAEAWWDWVWPEFERYWAIKKYRSVSRAILGWAVRIRPSDLDKAFAAAARQEDLLLSEMQENMNDEEDEEDGPDGSIDYFGKLN